jgi:hypothetical protein
MSQRTVSPRLPQRRTALGGILIVLLFGCAKAENAGTAAHFDPAWADEWSPAVTQAYGSRSSNRAQ